VLHYCEELERAGKYQLYLWPPHCLLGTEGHALAGVIAEARLFHSYARIAQSSVEVKGGNPLTENYSVLRPEVLSRFDRGAVAQRNTQFLQTLLAADAVIIAGQAASHCVKSTIDDLLTELAAVDPELARKVYLVTDCMSAVTVPDAGGKGFAVDFTAEAEAALDRFAAAGMHLVTSTTPIASWPGLPLR
jgi:nicotinamidase-related amidase